MTPSTDDLIPEGYAAWPPSIQKRYWEGLRAIYFPDQAPGASTEVVPYTAAPVRT